MFDSQAVTFTVYGIPQSAGSKKGFPIRRKDGSVGVAITDSNPKGKDWKLAVAEEARKHFPEPLEGPLFMHVVFAMPRPKSHYRTGKNAWQLKDSAPFHTTVMPDTTKLFRCLEDALKDIAWKDDSQVAVQKAEKIYADKPHALVTIGRLER